MPSYSMRGQTEADSPWRYGFLRSKGNTIEAEVLRNIIAERVLGLPRSR